MFKSNQQNILIINQLKTNNQSNHMIVFLILIIKLLEEVTKTEKKSNGRMGDTVFMALV